MTEEDMKPLVNGDRSAPSRTFSLKTIQARFRRSQSDRNTTPSPKSFVLRRATVATSNRSTTTSNVNTPAISSKAEITMDLERYPDESERQYLLRCMFHNVNKLEQVMDKEGIDGVMEWSYVHLRDGYGITTDEFIKIKALRHKIRQVEELVIQEKE